MLESQLEIQSISPLEPFSPDWDNPMNCRLSVKRDDLLHPVISGNKWRKLKHNLEALRQMSSPQVLSFGGRYSNHLHALAYACHKLRLPMTAMVRGYAQQPLTPMLQDIKNWGCQLQFLDRREYQKREDPIWLQTLSSTIPGGVVIPEGGSNQLALDGVADIIREHPLQADAIVTPVGSGGTLAGLIHSGTHTQLVGIATLKGEGYLEERVTELSPHHLGTANWQILHQFHHGGYAKSSPELHTFCSDFNRTQSFKIEPVYSGKLFYALKHLLAQGYFARDSHVVAIHTGGLQGSRVVSDH